MVVNGTLDLERVRTAGQALLAPVLDRIVSADFLLELGAIIAAGLIAGWLAPRLVRSFKKHIPRVPPSPAVDRAVAIAASVAVPSLWLLVLWLAVESARATGREMKFADSAVALLVAWIVIRLLSHVVRSVFWSRIIFVAAWSIAALEIFGLLDRIEASLAKIGITYGEVRISALNMVRAVIVLAVLLWLAGRLRAFLERRILLAESLTPTLRVLFVQMLKIALPAIAVLIALPVLGVNLTAITVFGGALAVGVGLGLQKIVANLVSGILILGGGSIRPGDVIAVKDKSGAEAFGRVKSISANYLSLQTRGGKEYLIPNETFLTNGVENWTHSDNRVRLKIPFRISYDGDPKLAMALALDAAAATPRVIKEPPPVCLLTAFGDTTIEFELRIWIEDPMNGLANLKSDCLLQLWDRFQAHGIRIVPRHIEVHLASAPDDRILAAKESAARHM
jgi:small-conductance mechanosensitive channel